MQSIAPTLPESEVISGTPGYMSPAAAAYALAWLEGHAPDAPPATVASG